MEDRIKELEHQVDVLLEILEGINRTIRNINEFNSDQVKINRNLIKAINANTESIGKISKTFDIV